MSQEVMIAGALFSDVPSIRVPDSNGNFHPFTDVSDTTAAAADVATGKYFYAADGTRTAGTSSGGGGASNLVTGTFTLDTIGANTIAIPYTGNGYPLTVAVYLANGEYNDTDWKNAIHRYAIEQYLMVKTRPDVAPYFGADISNNQMAVCLRYKNSDTKASSMAGGHAIAYCFGSSDALVTVGNSVKFKGDVRTLSVRIVGDGSSSTAYGFLAGITYEYMIVYSE